MSTYPYTRQAVTACLKRFGALKTKELWRRVKELQGNEVKMTHVQSALYALQQNGVITREMKGNSPVYRMKE